MELDSVGISSSFAANADTAGSVRRCQRVVNKEATQRGREDCALRRIHTCMTDDLYREDIPGLIRMRAERVRNLLQTIRGTYPPTMTAS